jgi:hypothetical protein
MRLILLFCFVSLVPLGCLTAQDAGPSMQDTINYLVDHIRNKAGGTWNDYSDRHDFYYLKEHYDVWSRTNGINIFNTREAYQLHGQGPQPYTPPGGWTLDLYFRDIIPNRFVINVDTRTPLRDSSDNPRWYLTFHFKSTKEADDYRTIVFTNEAEAQRVQRALEHGAQLAGVKPDPFDK